MIEIDPKDIYSVTFTRGMLPGGQITLTHEPTGLMVAGSTWQGLECAGSLYRLREKLMRELAELVSKANED